MIDHSSHLMLLMLRREYPEIHQQIADRINKTLPKNKLADFNMIRRILEKFQYEKGIGHMRWNNDMKQKDREKTRFREMAIALILMFYDPEKLYNLSNSQTKQGLVKTISKEMNCGRSTISQSVYNAVAAFKNYREFKEEIIRLYDVIKNKYKFFVN